ncbi:MAG: hypothetical protein R2856_06985 [Caldilineaceae bacterium]
MPFVQVDSALTRQYDGTGLGYHTVHRWRSYMAVSFRSERDRVRQRVHRHFATER